MLVSIPWRIGKNCHYAILTQNFAGSHIDVLSVSQSTRQSVHLSIHLLVCLSGMGWDGMDGTLLGWWEPSYFVSYQKVFLHLYSTAIWTMMKLHEWSVSSQLHTLSSFRCWIGATRLTSLDYPKIGRLVGETAVWKFPKPSI